MNNIVVVEYDSPLLSPVLNYEPGIYFWKMKVEDIQVTDDNGNVGYYYWQNAGSYTVKSFKYENIDFSAALTYEEMTNTANSFYYDSSDSTVYARREDFDPFLSDNLFIGVAVGYSLKENTTNYYNKQFYEPRIKNILNIKKSIDPLFYGLLKYSSGNIDFFNQDGHFDDWRERNLFGMSSRILVGEYGDAYENFESVYTGYIENDSSSWEDFRFVIQDPRKGLTQGVSTNLLTQEKYLSLSDSNVDQAIPVAYGQILNAKTYCLNEEEATAAEYDFIFADTAFNPVSSYQQIRVDNVPVSPVRVDLANGIFTLLSTVVNEKFDDVTIDFKNNIENGIDILKDLMKNYDSKNYISNFFDIAEIDNAELNCRNTSLYIDNSSTKLSKAIESVCNDCDIRFFMKDSGVYTARLYDENREPVKTIESYEWIGPPKIINNGDEFLTSARIGYNKNIKEDEREYYENKDFVDEVFKTYKKYKTETFDTSLTTKSEAIEKSNTIMNISKEVSDIVERSLTWDYRDIEATDFIIANPKDRISAVEKNYGVYEVMSVVKNLVNFTVKLKLRLVKQYEFETFSAQGFVNQVGDFFHNEKGQVFIRTIRLDCLVDENGDNLVDENNNILCEVVII